MSNSIRENYCFFCGTHGKNNDARYCINCGYQIGDYPPEVAQLIDQAVTQAEQRWARDTLADPKTGDE